MAGLGGRSAEDLDLFLQRRPGVGDGVQARGRLTPTRIISAMLVSGPAMG
jgi:hypothetical protein